MLRAQRRHREREGEREKINSIKLANYIIRFPCSPKEVGFLLLYYLNHTLKRMYKRIKTGLRCVYKS